MKVIKLINCITALMLTGGIYGASKDLSQSSNPEENRESDEKKIFSQSLDTFCEDISKLFFNIKDAKSTEMAREIFHKHYDPIFTNYGDETPETVTSSPLSTPLSGVGSYNANPAEES